MFSSVLLVHSCFTTHLYSSFILQNWNCIPIRQQLPIPSYPEPMQPLLSVSTNLSTLVPSYTKNYMAFDFFATDLFHLAYVLKFHPHCSMCQNVLLLKGWKLFHCVCVVYIHTYIYIYIYISFNLFICPGTLGCSYLLAIAEFLLSEEMRISLVFQAPSQGDDSIISCMIVWFRY